MWTIALAAIPVAVIGGIALTREPMFGLMAVVALLLVSVVGLRQPTHAVALALVLLYSNLPVLAASRVGVPAILTSLVVPGLLFVPVWHHIAMERRPLLLPRPTPWLMLYMVALVVATVLSPFPGAAASHSLVFLTEGLLLYLLIVNAIRSPAVLSMSVWALVLTAAGLALLSVVQTVTGSYATDFFGLAQHSVENVDAFLADADNGPARVGGPIGEKNRYAQILLMLLPLPLVTALRHPRPALRLAGMAATVVCASGIALTFSRGAAVAAVLLLVTMFLMRVVGVRALLAGALAVVVIVVVLPRYGERLADASAILGGRDAVEQTDGAVQGRLSSNIGAIRVFLDHPLTGVGPGNYPRFHKDAVEDLGLRVVPFREVHNLYPHVAAESGLLGLVAFAGLVLATLRGLWRIHRSHPPDSLMGMLATGLFLGLLAYLYSGLFLHLSYARYFWMLVALGAAAISIVDQTARRRLGEEPHDRPGPGRPSEQG